MRSLVPLELVAMAARVVVVSRENFSLVEVVQPGKEKLKDHTKRARHVFVDRERSGDDDNACDHESHEHNKVVPSIIHGSDSSVG